MTEDEDQSVEQLKIWLSNVEYAQRMWAGVAENDVALFSWRNRSDQNSGKAGSDAPECGAAACFGGHAAWWPKFVDQGITVDLSGAPRHMEQHMDPSDVSFHLFGEWTMFAQRGEDIDQDSFGEDIDPDRSDWQAVAERLQTRYMALCLRLDC